jgi:hypothetical protein
LQNLALRFQYRVFVGLRLKVVDFPALEGPQVQKPKFFLLVPVQLFQLFAQTLPLGIHAAHLRTQI